MQKIPFEDYPSTNTPIDASTLNQLQNNVENSINALVDDVEEISNALTYETTEKVVGTWNGKTLYRKYVNPTFSMATNETSKSVEITTQDVDEAFIDYSHSWFGISGSSTKYPLTYSNPAYNVGASNSISAYSNKIVLTINKSQGLAIDSLHLVLEYTKLS